MSFSPLLLITNTHNEEPQEDLLLADYLSKFFAVTLVDITKAAEVLPSFKSCLMRNVWPSRLFVNEFNLVLKIAKEQGIKLYNPPHRNNFVEDKNYLVDLFEQKFPVIPTVSNLNNLSKLGDASSYTIKPIDGCSSEGVEKLSADQISAQDLSGFIIQPTVQFKDEISWYYIDNIFVYAVVSGGPDQRWELQEYTPTKIELDWSKQFVDWNKLPYGLQRIDACRLADGQILLMEIEDTFPVLSLDMLSQATKTKLITSLVRSLNNKII